ncbi:MAG: DUF1800 domain-containing protein [Candidatus Sulfotelmatobacter sp.]
MPVRHVKFAIVLLSVGLACAVPPLLARKKDLTSSSAGDQRRALHALNRLTFGPRPGDVQRVVAMGVDQWIDVQLHPEKIDDRALDAKLEPFRTTRMTTRELAETFPDGQEINQVMNGKRPMPSDAALRMIYQVQIARRQERKELAQEKNSPSVQAQAASSNLSRASASDTKTAAEQSSMNQAAMNAGATGSEDAGTADTKLAADNGDTTASAAMKPKLTLRATTEARRREDQVHADPDVQQLQSLPPDQRFKKVLNLSPDAQLAFADSLRGGKHQDFFDGVPAKQKEILLAMNNPAGVVTDELTQAKLIRAIYSERQLEEVMTDFWFNHFNVFLDKGVDRLLVTSYERDVIRPHVFGKFEDLLVATAKSPAMLFYLDNWLSVGPNSDQAMGIPQHANGPYGRLYPPRPRANAKKRPSGLNENYGRELLELHTLSVNGGYSQRDVTEVAKVFTGWTIEKPYQGGGFKFEPRMHEPGPKFVLGRRIKPKGEGEGLEVLHRLATSPQTAHFISLKLAQRFVSDDPPPALVDRMAKTFLQKKGDIREVLIVLFHSPEFWDDTTFRAKVKTPLEFVASAVRATGAGVDNPLPLTRQLNNMGMPLYGAQPPTGYSMKAETWVSSSALLNRMNFSLALTNGKIKGVTADVAPLAGNNGLNSPPDATLALSALETSLLDGNISKQTHDSIAAQIDSARPNGAQQMQDSKSGGHTAVDTTRPPDVRMIAGLLLGSPEFQRK